MDQDEENKKMHLSATMAMERLTLFDLVKYSALDVKKELIGCLGIQEVNCPNNFRG